MPTFPEVLVVGYAPGEGASRWPIVAEVPPLVTVVRAGPDDLASIARHARLAIGRRADGSPVRVGDERALDELDDDARLYLTAWEERPLEKADRPGEGLPWDAPGFEPPGPPTNS
jgi:hypothetical protein